MSPSGHGAPLRWVKSSASANGNTCVEVASLPDDGVAVRNSNEPSGPVVTFTGSEWQAFLLGAKAGEFDALD